MIDILTNSWFVLGLKRNEQNYPSLEEPEGFGLLGDPVPDLRMPVWSEQSKEQPKPEISYSTPREKREKFVVPGVEGVKQYEEKPSSTSVSIHKSGGSKGSLPRVNINRGAKGSSRKN